MTLMPPGSSVVAKCSDEIEFVDAGGNTERVLCPNCGADLSDGLWQTAMDQAWVTRFSDLKFRTPCCDSPSNLNRLVYEWPAGFAKFVLEASGLNVGRFLPEQQIESVARTLGCQVRQILTRV